MTDGGVVAIAGFRYQMLRATEEILELHANYTRGDWAVEIEHATNDKVDYAVYRSGNLVRVVQVKASLPFSSTKLVLKSNRDDSVARILEQLAYDFPLAPEVVLISNRQGPWKKIQEWLANNQDDDGPTLRAERDPRSVYDVERSVRDTLRDIRLRNQIPSDPETISTLAAILEQRLWSLGSQDLRQVPGGRRWLKGKEVESILGLKDQELAKAVGELSWAMRWKEPAARAILRPAAMSFLANELSLESIARGQVSRTVLCGFGGLGKSTVAAVWAAEHQNLYGVVIWITGKSSEALEADVRQLLSFQFGQDAVQWPPSELQHVFLDWLQTTQRSWLLVIDNADNLDVVRDWIPSHGFGHVIITTRDSTWPATHALSLEIGRLTNDEIESLVHLRQPGLNLSTAELNLLMDLSDRWALGVDMVLAWVGRTGHRIADLDRFDLKESRQLLLDQPELRPIDYPDPVVVLIIDALGSVQSEDPAAWSLLQSASAVGGASVPVALVGESLNTNLSTSMYLDNLVAHLRARSLVSPFSIADPRLGVWGHRINVHDLITQTIAQVDPVSPARWMQLVERVTDVVLSGTQGERFTLVLSLAAVIRGIDANIRDGKPFSVSYLTLLGNSAVSLAMNGQLQQAAERLEYERRLASSPAVTSYSRTAEPAGWFGLVATAQLASIRFRLGQVAEALMLLEEIVPRIDRFKFVVDGDALSHLMEMAIDTLYAIDDPELTDRRDHLLKFAGTLSVQPAMTAFRTAELLIREGKLNEARTVCENALSSSSTIADSIQLYCLLAESWSIEDAITSNQLLEKAQFLATENDIDTHLVASHSHNVVHQRISHLLKILTVEHHLPDLRSDRYRGWFELGHVMPTDVFRNDRDRIMILAQQAWLRITRHSRDVNVPISSLVAMIGQPLNGVSSTQTATLRLMVWGTEYADACCRLEYLEPCGPVVRAGSTILIEASEGLWHRIPELQLRDSLGGQPLMVAHRYGPYILIDISGWGLMGHCLEKDIFESINDDVELKLVRPGSLESVLHYGNEGRVEIEIKGPIVPLGVANELRPSSTYIKWKDLSFKSDSSES